MKKPTGARAAIAGEMPPAGLMFAMAKGGGKWHLKPTDSDAAACGHTPKSKFSKHMVARAGWRVLKEPDKGLPAHGHCVCRACEASL